MVKLGQSSILINGKKADNMLIDPEKIALKLSTLQLKKPWTFLSIALILTIFAGIYASTIKFDSSYEALLPEDAKEIKNADDVREKTGGTRQLVLAISGKSPEKRLEFAKKIAPFLKQINGIQSVDLEFPVDFFEKRAFWLSDIKTLDKLIPALEDAVRIAKTQANPFALSLDEEAEEKELKDAWDKVEKIAKKSGPDVSFDKVLTTKDNKYTFLIAIPSIKFTDMEAAKKVLANVKDVVKKNDPQKYNVQVKYAGALAVIHEQHIVMKKDMVTASLLAIILGVLLVAGFTKKIWAPFVVSAALLAGIVWTFAAAKLFVGHVNVITGFLVAVLVGLGIDFGIHLFVRFFQEIKDSTKTFEEAFKAFVVGTAAPATVAALTTAGVFYTFAFAEFRGFSEFGLIAGTGVFFTLFSNFLILPPLILVVYKNIKRSENKIEKTTYKKSSFPKPLSTIIVLTMFAIAGYGGYSSFKIPFKNNFRELRGHSAASDFTDYVNSNLGAGFNPAVFLADSIDDAKKIKSTLVSSMNDDAKKKFVPNSVESVVIGNVVSVTDLLPQEIEEHKKRIDHLNKILFDKALNREVEKDTKEAKNLKKAREMAATTTWSIDDIPQTFRRKFVTKDKKNPQYLVLAWSKEPHDADFLAQAWENKLETISSSLDKQGIKHQHADETLIIAWVYKLVKADGPSLLIMSALVVLFFLVLDFRNLRDVLLTFIPLSFGMLSFIGVAHLLKMEINMFNMIVIPSVIGIGIDNAVHILHRYYNEGKGSIIFVIKSTGSAALLASATTGVGFGASIVSHNIGLQSMGHLAIVGICTTFIAAVVFLPALLSLLEPKQP